MLIANNFNINSWIFKIDDEFSGRGLAIFNVDSLKSLKEIKLRGNISNVEKNIKDIKEILN